MEAEDSLLSSELVYDIVVRALDRHDTSTLAVQIAMCPDCASH